MFQPFPSRHAVSQGIEYPRIDAVPEHTHRPFWSVMIPVYNRTRYVERALTSILQQDPGPEEMEIEVVDDCSTEGNLEELVRSVGQGRVSLHRQPRHVSMSANWNTCVARARSRWVHILHDDDMVRPGMYAAYRRFIEDHPKVVLLFSPVIFVDENDIWTQIVRFDIPCTASGLVTNAALELVKVDFICASAAVVSRDAYVKTGGFATSLSYSADWEMWMRIAHTGPVGYIGHPHVLYRDHRQSASRAIAETGKNIKEIIQTIEIGVHGLPLQHQGSVRTAAYRNYACYANIVRRQLHDSLQHWPALCHACWTFRFDPSIRNLLRILQSVFWTLKSLPIKR